MKRTLSFIGVLFLATFGSLSAGYKYGCSKEKQRIEIPSVEQIQTTLKTKGYYRGQIDGDYGRGTKEAHYRYEADQKAVECFAKYPAPKEWE